jgi:hypothetical protein
VQVVAAVVEAVVEAVVVLQLIAREVEALPLLPLLPLPVVPSSIAAMQQYARSASTKRASTWCVLWPC